MLFYAHSLEEFNRGFYSLFWLLSHEPSDQSKLAITKIGNRGIRESGNRGIGESGNMETAGDIGMLFVVSSTTTIYKSFPKNQGNPPWDLARILSQKCSF